MSETPPLILTLALDARSFAFFDEQRRRHFPAERNFIPAHLTLFHALPGEEVQKIERDLQEICAGEEPIPLRITGLRSLGRGVAYRVESARLAILRDHLAQRWRPWLGPQDRQKHDPHITIQNKVDPGDARALLAALQVSFRPFAATGEGLDLWWYRGGPWEPAGHFGFPVASN